MTSKNISHNAEVLSSRGISFPEEALAYQAQKAAMQAIRDWLDFHNLSLHSQNGPAFPAGSMDLKATNHLEGELADALRSVMVCALPRLHFNNASKEVSK